MTAVDNNIQDQLNRVANPDSQETETTKPEEETKTQEEGLKEGTVENQQQTDASSDDTTTASTPEEGTQEKDGGQEKDDESSKKAGQAFAAMRTRMKELEEENKALKEQQSQAGQDQTQQDKKDDPTKEQPKADESYEELRERLEKTEKYVQQMQLQTQQQKVAQEVQELRDRHSLGDDEIYQFADSLEKQGYQIGQNGMTLSQMYTAMNQDKIINDAVEKAKKEVIQQQQPSAPKTGPTTSQTSSTKQKANVNQTLDRVAKKLTN